MSILQELHLTVTHTRYLGDQEFVKIEGKAVVAREDGDLDEDMRDKALDGVADLLMQAEKEHLPKPRSRGRDHD